MAGVLSSEQHAVAAAGTVEHGGPDRRALVRGQLRLKWTLWRRSYRGNVGKIIGTAFGALYGLGGLALLVFAMLGLTLWSGEGVLFPTVLRGIGAATVLAWLLIPLLAFGVDDTLDARAFAPYPRSARELQPGLFAAAALSLPALFTLLAVAVVSAFEAIWMVAFGPGALGTVLGLVVLLPANLAGLATCLLLPRAVFAHQASRSSSRGGRELGGIVALIVMLAALYGVSLGAQSLGENITRVGAWAATAAEVAAWTPFGAAFAIPLDVAEGAWLTALVRVLIAAAALVLLWRWWRRSLDAALTSALVGDASSGAAKVTALVPRWAPSNALGASVGRTLRYWRRDTRYLASLGVYPLVFVFLGAMGVVLPEQRPFYFTMLVVLTALSGVSLSNEVGFDGPAGWVNITAGVRARDNLLGRVIAMAVLVAPVMLVMLGVIAVLFGYASLLPMVLLGAAGMTVGGWGVSVAIGSILPYPASPPGTSPLKDKSASTGNAMVSMTVTMLAVIVPQLPALGLGIWGAASGNLLLQLGAGLLALVVGVVAFGLGLRIGCARLDARYPDLFQKVRAFL